MSRFQHDERCSIAADDFDLATFGERLLGLDGAAVERHLRAPV